MPVKSFEILKCTSVELWHLKAVMFSRVMQWIWNCLINLKCSHCLGALADWPQSQPELPGGSVVQCETCAVGELALPRPGVLITSQCPEPASLLAACTPAPHCQAGCLRSKFTQWGSAYTWGNSLRDPWSENYFYNNTHNNVDIGIDVAKALVNKMLLNTNQGIRPNSAGHGIFAAKLSSKSEKGQLHLQMSLMKQ